MKLSHCFAAIAIACGLSAVASAAEPAAAQVKQEALRQQAMQAPLVIGRLAATQLVCAGQLPYGWIAINSYWNPTSCGNPTQITFNVWSIERYTDLAVGSTLLACTGPVPAGWAVIRTNWNPTACGQPSQIVNNQMTIQRLR
ncbi:hypothetical protein ACPRNU_01350 [Chromobacterium vaccinii]|uniref:hypothetical protein n=1 Tax=Chromobacterium vaccinii TaxID=1108595 RepID=UPI003C710B6A